MQKLAEAAAEVKCKCKVAKQLSHFINYKLKFCLFHLSGYDTGGFIFYEYYLTYTGRVNKILNNSLEYNKCK